MDEMVAGTSSESGTLNYEWYISDDGETIHLFEKYANSEAMIDHVNGFMEKWAGWFMACVEPTRFTVYGIPTDAAKNLIAPVRRYVPGALGGFARSG